MSAERDAVEQLTKLDAARAFNAGIAAGELLWILAGLVYFAPAGTDPFQRAVVSAADFLERVGFKPTGDDIRERWVQQ